MNSSIRNFLSDFGYCDSSEILHSLFRINMIPVLSVLSGLGVAICKVIEYYFSLKLESIAILMLLLIVELITGLWASVKEKKAISSKRLQRFGLKVLIYALLLISFSVFTHQYNNTIVMKEIYSGIHSFLVLYIIGVYSISILENTSAILGGGREFNSIIKLIRNKIKN